jgi:flagellar hook-length control protein FliK
MMSIAPAPAGSGSDGAPDATGGRGAAKGGESPGGKFQSLFGALSSPTPTPTPASAPAPAPAPESAEVAAAAASVAQASDDADEDIAAGEDAAELLASLGLLSPPVAFQAPQSATNQALAAVPGRNAQAMAAARNAPAAQGELVAAQDVAAGELFALLEGGEAGAVSLPAAAEPANGPSTATHASLNAWASTTQRLAGGQEVYARPALPEGQLRESVGTGRWKDELGAHLTLMATQGRQSGSLRLSPEHLGPLEIQITVNEDTTTNVHFGAQNAETRAALQEALPRLREMFASAGLQLGDAGVSGEAPRQRPEDALAATGGTDAPNDGEPTPPQGRVRSITHSGLLDTYA